LRTTVWYPTDDTVAAAPWVLGPPNAPLFRLGSSTPRAPLALNVRSRPLVVLSHGTGGSAAMLAWLAEPLAAAGYIVAAVNHHGNTSAEAEPTAAGFTLWWERATDVSRVIDRLLADSVFGAHIDTTLIGVAGFSLGGYTTLMLAGARTSVGAFQTFCGSPARDATCEPQPEFPHLAAGFENVRRDPAVSASLEREHLSFRDARMRAAYAIAPVGRMLTDESLDGIRLPVRIVVGSADRSAPPATNGQYMARRIPGATFELIPDAGHYTFLAECEPAGQAQRPDLCQDSFTIDRAEIHRRVAADALTFFTRAYRTR
jgi:predicted dienelactone hydrolase